MNILVNISEEDYNIIKKSNAPMTWAEHLIKRGKPLPKGHGRFIILSENAIKRELTPFCFSCQNWISEAGLSNATVTIVEADREREVEK